MTRKNPPAAELFGEKRRRSPLNGRLGVCAWTCVASAAAVLLFTFLWRDDLQDASGARLMVHYLTFMVQTFRFHLALGVLAVGVLGLPLGRWKLAGFAIVIGCVSALPELPPMLRSASDTEVVSSSTRPEIVVFSANLLYGRGDPARLLLQINQEKPDVLLFQEWNQSASRTLKPLLIGEYPHAIIEARESAFGQAVFSRLPLAGPPRLFPPGDQFADPQVTIAVLLESRPMNITNIHLWSPVNLISYNGQRRQARALHDWCASRDSTNPPPEILMGDFNAVRTAPAISGFAPLGYEEAHALIGVGRASTWPRTSVAANAPGVRIDNALIHPSVECTMSRAGENFGSDHRPIVIRVRWKTRAESSR